MAEASFRARKRQKVYRKRVDDDDDDDATVQSRALLSPPAIGALTATTMTNISASAPSTAPDDAATALAAVTSEEGAAGPSVATILRRARKQKVRGLGVEFSSSSASGGKASAATVEGGGGAQQTMVAVGASPSGAEEDVSAEVLAAAKRFAPQTGRVADTFDKHMMAYIDSKMAEMREGERAAAAAASAAAAAAAAAAASSNGTSNRDYDRSFGATNSASMPMSIERQPAGMGKLMEIDLGPEAAQRNIERTAEATRRLQNGGSLDQANEQQPKGRRGRKRRTSEDIRRDKLVEEILKESRLEIYDDPSQQQNEPDGDEAADDRIVEQFRRDFMEAVQTRNNRRPPASASSAAKGKADERPKGPKLGGSRSARAAMRAMEEKQGKKR